MSEENVQEPVADDSLDAAIAEAVEATAAANQEAAQESAQEPAEKPTEQEAAPTAEEAAAAEAVDSEYRARLREFTRELKKLPGEWFIIQCYSGYENKVKANLDMRIQTLEVEDYVFDVVVPIEQIVEKKDGKKKIVKRKLLPGYVLVRMELNDAAWSVVRDTPGVTSFVGNEGKATRVQPREVAKFLMPQTSPKDETGEKASVTEAGEQIIAMPEPQTPKVVHDYQVGEAVTILSGPLASVSATISEIDPETGKMQGLVSIFGRETPVELTASEIERIN